MKKILFLFLLGCSFAANSQQLTGTILNNENKPIENAEVHIESLQLRTTSDSEGNFEFNDLPKAVLKIKIAVLGYKTVNKEVDLKQTDKLDVAMETSVFNMDEVIVSAPFNKLQSENVMKVEKTTLKQLREAGAITLAEGLGQTPGVESVSTGVGIAKPVIRGLRGNRIIVYNAGVRLENQQWGEEHGLGVDDAGIESYEVIKGPASLLYGSDALGGVIYFNPEKFASNDEFNANAGTTYFSNTNGYKAQFGAKKSINGWKFIANASRSEHSDYETGDGTSITNSRFNETNFNTAIGFNNKFIASTLRYLHNSSELGITEEIGDQTNTKSLEEPFQDLSSNLISVTNTIFLKNSKITANFGFNNNVRKEFEEHHHDEEEEVEEEEHEENEEAALDLALKTYNYDIKWHLPKKNNLEAIVGVQGIYQTNENSGEEILIPDAKTNDIGLMTNAVYTQGEHTFQGGIRFDHRNLETEYHSVEHEGETHEFNPISEDYSNVSASLGYKTKLFKNLNTRVNLASGFKAPTLNELASNGEHHGSNRFEIGNSNLKSERSFQADLGLEYSNDYFEFVANGFYNNIADFIFASPTGAKEEELEVEYLQENAMLYGGEFGVHFHPKEIDWLHVTSNFQTVVGEQENGDYLPFIPASKLTSSVRANLPKRFKSLNNGFAALTLENNFDQENDAPFETRTGGFSLLNFGLGGNVTFDKVDLDFNFNINNLLDKSYVNHLSRLKANNIPNIGRNFVFGVRASI